MTGPRASLSTTWSGIASITRSSSAGVRNCKSGSASPARRRLGRAASSTGLLGAQPLRTASPNTECRNVITLRTVFGDAPRASIRLASRSTSSVLTAAILRLPQGGRDVRALHRLAVLPIGLPGALDRDPLPQPVGDLVDRENLDR